MKLKLFVYFIIVFYCLESHSQVDTTLNLLAIDIQDTLNDKSDLFQNFDSTLIKDNNTYSLASFLDNFSSLHIKFYGNASLATISLRGSEASQTQILWDDIPINNPMLGQIDLNTLPLFYFDNINILKGISSSKITEGGLGGSLQLNNKIGKKTMIYFNQELGSFANSFTKIATTYKLSNNIIAQSKAHYKFGINDFPFVNFTLQDSPLVRQVNSELLSYGIMHYMQYKNKKNILKSSIWYSFFDRGIAPTMLKLNSNENQKDKNLRISTNVSHFFKHSVIKLSFAYLNDFLQYTNPDANINSINTSQGLISSLKYNYFFLKNTSISAKYRNQIYFVKSSSYEKNYNRHFANISINKEIFKKLHLNINNIFLTDNYNKSLFNPSILLTYKIFRNKDIYIKSGTGRNIRFPTLNDLFWQPGGNTKLLPEKVNQWDFSFIHTINHSRYKITYFKYFFNDKIIWLPDKTGIWKAQNILSSINEGIEFENLIKFKLYKKINMELLGNYTLVSAKNNFGKYIIYIPKHKVSLSIILKFKNFSASYNYNYTDKRFINSENTQYMPFYDLHNIYLSYIKNFKHHTIKFKFRIDNLQNINYQVVAWRPMPGRTFYFSLEYFYN